MLVVAAALEFLAFGEPVLYGTGLLVAVTALLGAAYFVYRARRQPLLLQRYRTAAAAAWTMACGVLPGAAAVLWVDDLCSDTLGMSEVAGSRVAGGVGFAVVLAAIAVAAAGWRVLRDPDVSAAPDFAAAGVRAISEIGEPDDIAARTLPLLWERASWIIRRVERVRFVDRTMARRHVSVDFRVPASLEFRFAPDQIGDAELELLAGPGPVDEGDETPSERRYVPVSVLRGWPPVLNLDLRDASGDPLPLLSKATTNALDGRLLIALGQHAFGDYTDDFEQELLLLVHDDAFVAQRAFVVVTEAVDKLLDDDPNIDTDRVDRFVNLARLLVHNTLLWVPVTEDIGTRQIIKLAYDEPVRRRLSGTLSLLTGLGLRGHIIGFEVGQIGDAGSYHLEIELPFPLEVTGGVLVIASGEPRPTRWQRLWKRCRRPFIAAAARVRRRGTQLEASVARWLRRNPPGLGGIDRSNYPQLFTRRLHFYASGQRSRPAMAWVRVVPERRGVPLAGAVTGVLVAAAVTAFNEASHEIYVQRGTGGIVGASVAFLLLAPALVSYVLTRPADHPFVTRMLSGIRVLTVTSVLVAIACAATLLAALARQDEVPLDNIVPWLMRASWALAGALLIGLILPPRRRSQRGD